MFECFTIAAEEKVLLDKRPELKESRNTGALDEELSFQAAYKSDKYLADVDVKVEGIPSANIEIRAVEPVACTFPAPEFRDDYYISDKPFLCPDILRPINARKLWLQPDRWQSVWFTVRGLDAGSYNLAISFVNRDGEILGRCDYSLDIKDFVLGEHKLFYTNWFHYDGIARYYNCEVFSERYNEIMYRFISDAVKHGVNMLLTPLFTPPLDTRVGSERLTVQLVDVTREKGEYSFSFARLVSFMKNARELGIKYFEMSHLFTQWGAAAAPKIMATDDGVYRRIFGWDTPAAGGEYERFLKVFLPELKKAIDAEGLYKLCFFHISDEPNDTNIDNYVAARAIFSSALPDATVMDALSHYEFYERGLLTMAIAATSAIQVFLDKKTPDLWAYYCCGQSGNYLSNRFMAMPGERTRVLGFQLFLNDIKGFLQWGYNFYNSTLSDVGIDPYAVNDGCGGFPSGDSFIVYPGENGPLDSVRHEHTFDAIQDFKLMCVYAEKFGRDEAEKLLLDNGFKKDFVTYPRDAVALKEIRRKAVERISSGR